MSNWENKIESNKKQTWSVYCHSNLATPISPYEGRAASHGWWQHSHHAMTSQDGAEWKKTQPNEQNGEQMCIEMAARAFNSGDGKIKRD